MRYENDGVKAIVFLCLGNIKPQKGLGQPPLHTPRRRRDGEGWSKGEDSEKKPGVSWRKIFVWMGLRTAPWPPESWFCCICRFHGTKITGFFSFAWGKCPAMLYLILLVELTCIRITRSQVIHCGSVYWPEFELLSSKPTILRRFITFDWTYLFHSHPGYQNFVGLLMTSFLSGHFGAWFSLVFRWLSSYWVILVLYFRWSSDDFLFVESF